MKYSIIIATYNAEEKIANTLNSICEQRCKDYEIIIIDGNSMDNTLNIVDRYKKKFCNLTCVSEKDNGIYDAMNKGINLANGEYTIFLGAGDCLYDNTTLEEVSKLGNKDILCGKVVLNSAEKEVCDTKIGFAYLLKRHPICHQQLFARTYLLKMNPFNLSYKIAADQDWIMRMIKKKVSIQYINLSVCLYDVSGVSNSGDTRELGIYEFSLIQKKYFPIFYYIRQIMLFVKEGIKRG